MFGEDTLTHIRARSTAQNAISTVFLSLFCNLSIQFAFERTAMWFIRLIWALLFSVFFLLCWKNKIAALAKAMVYAETRWNTGTILSGILHRSKLSQTERCHRFGSMRTSRLGTAIGASQAEISAHVWCEDTTSHILFGRRFRRGHELLGQLHMPGMQFTGFVEAAARQQR